MSKRLCLKCHGSLPGRKGHGWVSRDGRAVYCTACAFPESHKWRAKAAQYAYGVVPTQLSGRSE